jgi:hypothetical protein
MGWARRLANGGGNVPDYVEQAIFGTMQSADNFTLRESLTLGVHHLKECCWHYP